MEHSRSHGLGVDYQEQAEPGQIYSGVSVAMLRGYRGIVAAVGLILASPSYAQNTKADQPPASGRSKAQLDRIAVAIERLPIASAPDGGCQPGQDNYQSDLCAQWKAADATAESANWTFWSLIAGAVGLALGFGTLFAAWRAAHWAKKAAGHTQSGVVEAQETKMIAQEGLNQARSEARAWIAISVEPEKVDCVAGQVGFFYTISIQNIGKTVAEGVWIRHSIFDLARDIHPALDIITDARTVHSGDEIAVMPGETISTFRWHVPTEHEFRWDDGTFKPGLVVFVLYEMGGKRHESFKIFRFAQRTPNFPVPNADGLDFPAKYLLSRDRLPLQSENVFLDPIWSGAT